MTGVDALSIIVAALVLPLITSIFTRPNMAPATKRWIAVGVAAVLGTVGAVVTGQIDIIPQDAIDWVVRVLGWIAAVAVSGTAAYNLLKDPAKAIESATSATAPAQPTE